jgi:hypothetical protein
MLQGCVGWRADNDNPIPTRFLAPTVFKNSSRNAQTHTSAAGLYFFGSDFEFCTISLLVILKIKILEKIFV